MNETTLEIVRLLNDVGLFPGETVLVEINDLVQSTLDEAYSDGYLEAQAEFDVPEEYEYDY
jgi:hypothetical protein